MEKLDLSEFFTTRGQAQSFISNLSSVIDSVYKTDFDLESALSNAFGIEKKDKFISLLTTNSVNTQNKQELKRFFDLLLAKIPEIPILSITIAFEPNEEVLNSLSEWCITNIGKQVLFDIRVDPVLIAGATIFINGKYSDFSIQKQFEQIVRETLTNKNHAQKPIAQHHPNTQPPLHENLQQDTVMKT